MPQDEQTTFFVPLQDWLIDALALHDHMHLLQLLFADPTTLKVPHDRGCRLSCATFAAFFLIDGFLSAPDLGIDGHCRKLLPQVLHGGNNDVLWLQRDFHIYTVNMFDTFVACQVKHAGKRAGSWNKTKKPHWFRPHPPLGRYHLSIHRTDTFPAQELEADSKSLAYLLRTMCGVDTDKSWQRSDWRIR